MTVWGAALWESNTVADSTSIGRREGEAACGDSSDARLLNRVTADFLFCLLSTAFQQSVFCIYYYFLLSWLFCVFRLNMVGEMETKEKPKPTPDYLMQLMNDKKLMSSLPNFCGIFNHLERLLDEGKRHWTPCLNFHSPCAPFAYVGQRTSLGSALQIDHGSRNCFACLFVCQNATRDVRLACLLGLHVRWGMR